MYNSRMSTRRQHLIFPVTNKSVKLQCTFCITLLFQNLEHILIQQSVSITFNSLADQNFSFPLGIAMNFTLYLVLR